MHPRYALPPNGQSMELPPLFSSPRSNPFRSALPFHHKAPFSLWLGGLCRLQRFGPHCRRRCQRHDDVISRPRVPVDKRCPWCLAVVWRGAVHAILVKEDRIASLAFDRNLVRASKYTFILSQQVIHQCLFKPCSTIRTAYSHMNARGL